MSLIDESDDDAVVEECIEELEELVLSLHRYPPAAVAIAMCKLAEWKNHYYQVVRSCGITRKDGITSHGLRHQHANERYRELMGSDSPVRGGAPLDRDRDRAAREVVAEELGHSRESVTTHYLGR